MKLFKNLIFFKDEAIKVKLFQKMTNGLFEKEKLCKS